MSYKIRQFDHDTNSIIVEYDDGQINGIVIPVTNGVYPTGGNLNAIILAARPAPIPIASNSSEVAALVEPVVAPARSVEIITAAQAKVTLYRHNLLEATETIVALYPKDVQLWYENALIWERNNPYVIGLSMELDLAESYVDDLFTYASQLAS